MTNNTLDAYDGLQESALKQEISSLKAQLDELVTRDGEEEANLRKRKFKIESEVENWIHKYDQDMDEKQTELEDITVSLRHRYIAAKLM